MAIGSVAFPMTKTETTTQLSSVITTTTVLEHSFQSSVKTFDFDHIPYNFIVGNFTVQMVNNGTGYITPPVNGTSTVYGGFVWAFNVETPDGITTNTFFLGPESGFCIANSTYPQASCLPRNEWFLPNPENTGVQVPLNYGNIASLVIQWSLNTTSLYVSFIQYENIFS